MMSSCYHVYLLLLILSSLHDPVRLCRQQCKQTYTFSASPDLALNHHRQNVCIVHKPAATIM